MIRFSKKQVINKAIKFTGDLKIKVLDIVKNVEIKFFDGSPAELSYELIFISRRITA